MTIRDLIPWGRQENRAPVMAQDEARDARENPLLALHREVNRLFDDVFRGWDLPVTQASGNWAWPNVEVKDNDRELRVTAEVPGLKEGDIDLSVEDGVLTLRGERKEEKKDDERGYSERFYGRFERRLALPANVDEDKANARFDNGVLTITLPKTRELTRGRRIPINTETRH